MEYYAATIYVISDEVLSILGHQDDPQSQMSTAEVITFAIVSAKYFYSNHKMARYLCKKLNLFPKILSNSRLNRRIHQIPWSTWNAIFRLLTLLFKQTAEDKDFIVDSFPLASCQKNRIDKISVE